MGFGRGLGLSALFGALILGACGQGPDGATEGPASELSSPLTAASALLVVGNTTLNAGDQALSQRLSTLGFSVVVQRDSAATTADATGKALVLISSTVTSGAVGTKFKTVAVPVLVWESALLDDMGMTSTGNGTDYGTSGGQSRVVMVASSSDPMAAGLSGTQTVTSAASSFTWGKAGTGAVVVARLESNAGRAAVLRYAKGAAMFGQSAPERRTASS